MRLTSRCRRRLTRICCRRFLHSMCRHQLRSAFTQPKASEAVFAIRQCCAAMIFKRSSTIHHIGLSVGCQRITLSLCIRIPSVFSTIPCPSSHLSKKNAAIAAFHIRSLGAIRDHCVRNLLVVCTPLQRLAVLILLQSNLLRASKMLTATRSTCPEDGCATCL